jgi:hypothetical protein
LLVVMFRLGTYWLGLAFNLMIRGLYVVEAT